MGKSLPCVDDILKKFIDPIFVPCEQQFPDKKNYWLARLDDDCLLFIEQGDYSFNLQKDPIFSVAANLKDLHNSKIKSSEVSVGSVETPVNLIIHTLIISGKSIIIGYNKASIQEKKYKLSDDTIKKIQTAIFAIAF